MKTKTVWKRVRLWAAAVSVCMLALGLLMVLWPGISALAVCWVLGVLCLAAGACALVRYFRLGLLGALFRYDLALGLCSIIVGLALILHPDGAMVVLPMAMACYILVGGIFDVQLSVELRRLGDGGWWLTLALGLADAIFAFFLFLDPFDGAAALMVFAGVSLMVHSVQTLCLLCRVSRALRPLRGGPEGKIIDADWHSVE